MGRMKEMTVEEFYWMLQFIKNAIGKENENASINDIMNYLNNSAHACNNDCISYVLDGAKII